MTVVIDASVALKWFVEEDGTSAAVALLSSGEAIIAPDLVVAELCNAAWRLWRRGELSDEQARIVAARAAGVFEERVPLDRLAAHATEIALALNRPAYDCFYLALAVVRDTRLVSADSQLIQRVRVTPWEQRAVLLADFGSGS